MAINGEPAGADSQEATTPEESRLPIGRSTDGEATRPVFGATPSVFAKVLGSLFVESHAQAQLLQSVLEDGMRKHAGKHQETFLAKLYLDLVQMRDKAQHENWRGWED